MTRYTCSNPACPRREPTAAAEPPTCYTCARPMAVVTTERVTYRADTAQISFNGIRVNGGPFVAIPEPTAEQRARRAIGPLIVTLTPPDVTMADLEALQRDLQAELLRALTTIDRAPHDGPPVAFGGASDDGGDEHSIEILPGVFR